MHTLLLAFARPDRDNKHCTGLSRRELLFIRLVRCFLTLGAKDRPTTPTRDFFSSPTQGQASRASPTQ